MEWDFVIVGGGIAGASAGAELAKLGRVLLWEAEPSCGYHASGRSAAMFEENYGAAPIVALNRASRSDHEAAGHMTRRGFLAVGLAGEEAQLDADIATLGLAPLSPAEARAHVPILGDITRAGLQEEAHDLDTDAMLQAGLRAVRDTGRVETGRRVDRITRLRHGWEVQAGDCVATGRNLVNAAGAWADQIATLAGIAPIGLTPCRRSMARLAAPGGNDVSDWPMVMGAGERWYAKPDAGALIVSPAEEDPIAPCDAWADDMVLAEGLARYEAAVTEPVTRPLANWAGLRSFAPDRALVLGSDPTDPSFVWVAGQGGYGFQTAPAAARLATDQIAGRRSELGTDMVAALTPGRLR